MSIYTIGLTGGIASGKSTVAQAFAKHGVRILDADVAAREVLAPGSAGLAEVVAQFGTQLLDDGGALDRRAMRAHVFEHPEARQRLEAIVHPRVRERLQMESRSATGPYALVVIPLLAEGGGRSAYPWLDRILVVDVPVEAQIERLLLRDAIDERLAMRMVEAQATRHARLAIADDVLVNDGPMDLLAECIAALDRQYRHLATRS
jgi:dephospho-CoA kinase